MKLEQKQKAIELRLQGYSMRDICKMLGVAKSSVSLWVRHITLTDEQTKNLKSKHNIFVAAKVNREKGLQRHNSYKNIGYNLAKEDPNFRTLCALYWGEGAKTSRSFNIANSDVKMIKYVFNWCHNNGYLQKIRFRIATHSANKISLNNVKQWWHQQLPHLQESHWTKCAIIDSIKYNCKKVDKLPYGTAYLTVYDVKLFFNVMGGINYIIDSTH